MAKPVGLSHRPNVLFAASAERLAAAVRAAGGSDWVMATYLAGLSVECMLQALALHLVPTHDARHDLSAWLSKCPRSFRDTLLTQAGCERWNLLVAVWRNDLRYQSRAAFLGHLRRLGIIRGIKGGGDAIMRYSAKRVLESASFVHRKELFAWQRLTPS
jgi:hypothetical protein